MYSFLGVAVADLGSLLTLLWSNVCLCLPYIHIDLNFDPIDIHYLVTGMPHTLFTRISGWITAFITLERLLCIALPLKVRYVR